MSHFRQVRIFSPPNRLNLQFKLDLTEYQSLPFLQRNARIGGRQRTSVGSL